MYKTKYIKSFNKGSLFYPLKEGVILTSICIDVINEFIKDEKQLNAFKESIINSTVCIFKSIMNKRIENCYVLQPLLTKCSVCKSDRQKTIVNHMINTSFNIACNNLRKYLNCLLAINTITLSIVKTKTKGRKTKAIIANNIVQTNSGLWSRDKYKEFLDTYGAPKSGLVNEL